VKVAVCVKHAVDETELKLDQEGRPVLGGAAGKMSAFDKNAVEEALRLKAKHQGRWWSSWWAPPTRRRP